MLQAFCHISEKCSLWLFRYSVYSALFPIFSISLPSHYLCYPASLLAISWNVVPLFLFANDCLSWETVSMSFSKTSINPPTQLSSTGTSMNFSHSAPLLSVSGTFYPSLAGIETLTCSTQINDSFSAPNLLFPLPSTSLLIFSIYPPSFSSPNHFFPLFMWIMDFGQSKGTFHTICPSVLCSLSVFTWFWAVS